MTGRSAGIAIVLAALVVTACEPEATAPGATETPVPEPTTVVTTYQLDTTVWYAGLVLTFGSATSELDPRGGTVTVEGRVENPGQDDLQLDAPIRLTAGALSFEPVRGTIYPLVAAGSSVGLTLAFQVLGRGAVADAVLRIGAPDRHQASIPFRLGSEPAVTLEPVDLALKGAASAGDLRLVLSHGLLRWDLPDWADELPAASAALTLTYDATYRGGFSGGFAFTGDNVALTLPNGTVIGPRRDGHSQSVGVIGPGKTLRRLSTRFEIPADLPGTYVLVVQNGSAKGSIKFVLPG